MFLSMFLSNFPSQFVKETILTLGFIVALFTIGKTRKQCRCLSTGEWIKMWHTHSHRHTHIHTVECHSVIKNEIMPLAAG